MTTKQIQVFQGKGFTVIQFKTGDLAIFSYYIESQGQALLIDPTIQNNVYKQLQKNRNAKIQGILLTHIHADFLSGHLQFGGVKIYLGQGTETNFNPVKLKDEDQITLGQIKIRALHTPGHTLQSTCYVLRDANGIDQCVFTGDSLFLGGVGRPDLAIKGNLTSQQLADMLFDSLQKIKKLPSSIKIYPGHGAGSSCGKTIDEGNHCFLNIQLERNFALKADNREQFIKDITKISSPPKYFFYNARLNRQGPFNYQKYFQQSNKALGVQQFLQLRKNSIIIDVRNSQKQTEKGCIKGAVLMPSVSKIAQYAGALYQGNQNLLIFSQKQQRQQVLERLLRIGFINILGYNNFTIQQWINAGGQIFTPKYATIQQLQNSKNRIILDVRTPPEWPDKGVLQNALSIDLPNLQGQIKTQRQSYENKQIFVHCTMGFRARTAWSILQNNGVHGAYILPIGWTQLIKSNIPVVPYVS